MNTFVRLSGPNRLVTMDTSQIISIFTYLHDDIAIIKPTLIACRGSEYYWPGSTDFKFVLNFRVGTSISAKGMEGDGPVDSLGGELSCVGSRFCCLCFESHLLTLDEDKPQGFVPFSEALFSRYKLKFKNTPDFAISIPLRRIYVDASAY